MPYEQRSLRLDGQRRCLRLEPEFWSMLERIARQEQQALPRLIDRIDRHRQTGQGTGSALRCFVIRYFAKRATGQQANRHHKDIA